MVRVIGVQRCQISGCALAETNGVYDTMDSNTPCSQTRQDAWPIRCRAQSMGCIVDDRRIEEEEKVKVQSIIRYLDASFLFFLVCVSLRCSLPACASWARPRSHHSPDNPERHVYSQNIGLWIYSGRKRKKRRVGEQDSVQNKMGRDDDTDVVEQQGWFTL